jgi:hypothetical protein
MEYCWLSTWQASDFFFQILLIDTSKYLSYSSLSMAETYVVAIARKARSILSVEDFHQKLDGVEGLVRQGDDAARQRVTFEGSIEELYQKLGYTREQVHIETIQKRYPLPYPPLR